MIELTREQEQTLQAIEQFKARYGWLPTIRELAKVLGRGKSATHDRLLSLEESKVISREPGKRSAIRLLIVRKPDNNRTKTGNT